jgi:hypothetical protein
MHLTGAASPTSYLQIRDGRKVESLNALNRLHPSSHCNLSLLSSQSSTSANHDVNQRSQSPSLGATTGNTTRSTGSGRDHAGVKMDESRHGRSRPRLAFRTRDSKFAFGNLNLDPMPPTAHATPEPTSWLRALPREKRQWRRDSLAALHRWDFPDLGSISRSVGASPDQPPSGSHAQGGNTGADARRRFPCLDAGGSLQLRHHAARSWMDGWVSCVWLWTGAFEIWDGD